MLRFFCQLAFSLLILASCEEGFKETKGGLKYKIVQDKEGKTAEPGDIIHMHLKYNNAVDTLNTWKYGNPIKVEFDSLDIEPGSLEEGFLKLSTGDSAVFQVKNNILYQRMNMKLPEKLKPEERTSVHVKVDTIITLQSRLDYISNIKGIMLEDDTVRAQLQKEQDTLKKYAQKHDLNYSVTENGVLVAVIDSGKGEKAQIKDKLVVHYRGKFLNDSIFQSSFEMGDPFYFRLGSAQAILGWDEALAGLREGAEAIVMIPSPLTYGTQGIYDEERQTYVIPPNTPLVFEVKILEINPQPDKEKKKDINQHNSK